MKPSTRKMLEKDRDAHAAQAEQERWQSSKLTAEANDLLASAKRHEDYVADLQAMLAATA